MCIKTMSSLETSENTPSRKTLIAVGTAFIRGEDLASAGRIYIWDIIDVVPEPGRPETNRKFKLMAKEDVKGAVTALSELGTQGFLIAAQGQKCMVRGLKEDGTLLPVAFMDMQCYVTAIKEMPGTGLCLMADAVKGLWLTGYYVCFMFYAFCLLAIFSLSPSSFSFLSSKQASQKKKKKITASRKTRVSLLTYIYWGVPIEKKKPPNKQNADDNKCFNSCRRNHTNYDFSANRLMPSKSSLRTFYRMGNSCFLSLRMRMGIFMFCNLIRKVSLFLRNFLIFCAFTC